MAYATQSEWQVRDERGRRKYLSYDERKAFLAEADHLGPADRALCYILAFTGCRVSEALALTRHQFDPRQLTLTIKTLKRRKTHFRAVPIPEAVGLMLLALPPAPDGRFWTIHRSTAWRRIKSVMHRAGIDGPMATPKGLRHGFCLHAAARSVPPNLIQRWAGHASATTTAIYLDAVGVEERQFATRMW